MMIRVLYFILLVFSISCKTAEKTIIQTNSLQFSIDQSITILVDEVVSSFPNGTELAVAFTSLDSVSFYGSKKKDDRVERQQNRLTLFEIGSISKVFTTHLLSQMVLSGELNVDQSIADFFDFELGNKKDITLRQLASHSSGLPGMPDYFFNPLIDSINPYKVYTEKIMISDLRNEIDLDSESTGQWDYSNYGVSLLGHILSVKSKSSYEELLQNNILKPLRMGYSTSYRKNLNAPLVKGMTAEGTLTLNWDLSAITPAGGIISNVEDLAKYTISCYSESNKVFPFQSQKILEQPRKNVDQALGWMIYKRKNGNPYCYFHAGQTGGYASLILLQQDSQKSVIIFSNISETGNSILSLGFKLLKGLREGKYEKKK